MINREAIKNELTRVRNTQFEHMSDDDETKWSKLGPSVVWWNDYREKNVFPKWDELMNSIGAPNWKAFLNSYGFSCPDKKMTSQAGRERIRSPKYKTMYKTRPPELPRHDTGSSGLSVHDKPVNRKEEYCWTRRAWIDVSGQEIWQII